MSFPINKSPTYFDPYENLLSVSQIMESEEYVKNKADNTVLKMGTVFSGIGTPEYSLNRGGWKHENVFACEMDEYARKTYILNYGEPRTFYRNILDMNANKYKGHIHILFGGSPCQAFSIAGKGEGFNDTRGTLFYEYARVLKESEAPCFVYENVKGMVSHDKPKVFTFEITTYNWTKSTTNKLFYKKDFNKAALKKKPGVIHEGEYKKSGVVWNDVYYKKGYPSLVNPEYDGNKKGIGKTLHIVESTFKELGYYFKWTILNTKEHGIPQNRERIYIVGFRDEALHNRFKFREPEELKLRLIDMLEDNVAKKYYLDEDLIEEYKNHGVASRNKKSQAGKVSCASTKDYFHTINSGSHGYSMGFVRYENRFTWHTTLNTAIGFAQRGRYSDAKSMRMVGRRLNESGVREDYNYNIDIKQQFEFRTDFVANCITCVQKDSMVAIKNTPIEMQQSHVYDINATDSCKRIYAANGVSPSITTCGGGHREPKVAIANGLIELHDNEVRVKEAVTKGFTIAKEGDSINLSVPHSETRRGRVGNGVAQTLDCACNQAVYKENYIFRKLTPRECFRLQGFDDDFKFDVSDTQGYKQAGNAMSANVTDGILNDICNILGISKIALSA